MPWWGIRHRVLGLDLLSTIPSLPYTSLCISIDKGWDEMSPNISPASACAHFVETVLLPTPHPFSFLSL